ncbi:histidine acid phosphatase family protein [Entamoeba histolytica HM-1:IMSS-B]|uniref:Histidine acid phosphatase family protein n=6 Tax=Entamoeba histolytica TaxID=5759 RepID=C4LSW8_ENTH1|nr:hypothetical protein EHI_152850 [Entamoeba histolytica HM-1:IMSS]EMD47938.1 histidine acid phosphatase superfamily protein [Entamoeba histolytica KU27]EMH73051.1 histidine acid phosphatase family protein [Entamoeba histolytica HM-1:IMSS-B]EMS11163.1 histidine acid phosphatase superfamily protein [Entamoeba histolytica HM-3:IMSS]ENY61737.1 histidine acid phosphatase superfamily protein, putative [Entamoeba histolytica HM-1:IMSS-A]GAT91538.1 histidine acid phosphatase family protein [Entamoeb|eukprot:XP_655697.1 hypothetical protein EHI_152850 [Entamoeba histolytica HM-1:IMSS]
MVFLLFIIILIQVSFTYCYAEFCNVPTFSLKHLNNSTLNKIIIITRHGDRNSIFANVNQTKCNEGECVIGELTDIGKKQMNNLGIAINQLLKEYGISNITFESIRAQSTQCNRTINSAKALIEGLLNQKVNTELIDTTNSQYFAPHYIIDNTTVAERNKRLKILEDTMNDNIKQLIFKFKRLFKGEFKTTNLITSFINVYDYLQVLNCYNIPFPSNEKEQITIDDVISSEMYLSYMAGYLLDSQVSSLSTKYLRDEIISFLDGTSICKETNCSTSSLPIIELISGHDDTLYSLMVSLHQQDIQLPPYSSHIFIEKVQIGIDYFVRASYNSQILRICNNQVKLCPFQEFKDWLK